MSWAQINLSLAFPISTTTSRCAFSLIRICKAETINLPFISNMLDVETTQTVRFV